MYEINENVVKRLEIKKSIFITCLFRIDNEDEIKEILENIKQEYKDATHYCYAYILNKKMKSSDDGEPGGTAGVPILEVLIKKNITNILCVVIRYFGGIKLGTGGLVRAYTKSVKEALEIIKLLELTPSLKIEIIFSYDKLKLIDNILKDICIIDKYFNEDVKYIINIECSNKEIIDKLNNICNSLSIIEKSTITK